MSDNSDRFLSERETMVRDSARKVSKEVIAPTAAARDQSQAWPFDELKTVGDLGFLGMLVPEDYGGSGASFVEYILAIQEFAAADAGFATITLVHNTLGLTVYRVGSEEQRCRYLPKLVTGEHIGAALFTEPHAGSDTAAFRTSARRDGAHYVVNGSKQFISNGSEAGLAMALVVTDPASAKHGKSLLLIDPSQPGYHVTRVEKKYGQHTAHLAQIELADCRVPVEDLLGQEGSGYRKVMELLAYGRVTIASQAVGIARAALDAALRYASERKAYGAAINKLQAVSFDLAEMATNVEVAHQYVLHAARLVDAGVRCAKEAAIAKLFASEMAEKVCSTALQIHGGYGYLKDFPVERYCRDVRICTIYEGTSHIQKLIIARELS